MPSGICTISLTVKRGKLKSMFDDPFNLGGKEKTIIGINGGCDAKRGPK